MFAPTQAAKRPSWPSAPCLEPRLERWEPCPQPGSGESLGLPEAAACSLGRHSDPRAGPQRMLVSGAGASPAGVRGGSGLARRPGTSQAFLASVSLLGTHSSHPWLGARGVTCLFVGSHRKRWRLGCLAGLCWCSCRAQGSSRGMWGSCWRGERSGQVWTSRRAASEKHPGVAVQTCGALRFASFSKSFPIDALLRASGETRQ